MSDSERSDKTDGVFTIDQAGRVILCNDSCLSLLGYAAAGEIIGSHAIIFLPVPDEAQGGTPISQHPLLACARGEIRTAQMDGAFIRSDGFVIPVRYHTEHIWLEWSRRGAVCTFNLAEPSPVQ